MECVIRSFIGTRERQEDAADFCITKKGLFAVVCDGIGSREDGAASSKMAVHRFVEYFRISEFEDYPNYCVKAAALIDKEINEKYGDKCGTTVVTVFIRKDEMYWLSVGDSRLYIIRDGRIKQITTDHNYSYVLNVRKEKKIIDAETYDKEIDKGEQLVSFMGMGGIDLIDMNFRPFLMKQGDILLLTTDGLYKTLSSDDIFRIIISADNIDEAADDLISKVETCEGALDNTTLAIIKYDTMEEPI